MKGGCDNGWSEDQFKRDCEPVSDQLLIKMMIVMTFDGGNSILIKIMIVMMVDAYGVHKFGGNEKVSRRLFVCLGSLPIQ